ncbi:rRNA processing protein Faf1 [Schizosaccharomyces pombe]|uniref:Uncharacterized protein C3F10.08c n=1 Tax=Schizosaccharomyces pombe (strain 972 / ATCC 24843) TaxID=284812 RepID=YAW8_SCHPO|nr:putative rRNA processing protein Faf1 [Schizosaccharomyces pombe]Q10183.1 RecName: Full=Uncharacterized protein C3F10.08c [Schizosaccharomyces pombe 972h-]CAA93306.1 rRNA processing protein Faf1 (predicted) [Schizosaccharomyces pombe]|eukprot:NP_593940.1 putative rRNA processing protein Faf1 [Schizosaccharomyces pombe]
MSENALLALQRHFEDQFGHIEGLQPVSAKPSETAFNSDASEKEQSPTTSNEEEDAISDMEDKEDVSFGSKILRVSHQEVEKPTLSATVGRVSFLKKMPKLEDEEEILAKKREEQKLRKRSRQNDDGSDDDEVENLKNDLELQKLLRESHLLHEATSRTGQVQLVAEGKIRHKVVQQHIAQLGGKKETEKMPMAARRGMKKKQKHIEKVIENEARESGTVLAKKRKERKQFKKGFRPVTFSAPGKLVGGTLLLPKSMIPK